ncbi:glutathione S-transferase, putative [Cordyceps militaris CM01]|uniref:Glutathione S-transferase, putative n=2 Tax=Cordyceps militaris TaxID=73501 RepID=G3JIR8_CORMM|nr:glutathione S-transferase, putative [Cordyceps militaris CM01]ATY58934.1 Glutathione S-transferase [Cordyceps militaris]EGX91117.1 glutathione S-transferase, putative [Cordyceps militaris CM01]
MTITVHHLQVSQSERIPWLLEELGVPYTLKTYQRAPLLAPAAYKALHPSGAAPVIDDDGLVLAESGACVEYLARRHGAGRLFVDPADPDYPAFLYWWHWSNGTLQPAVARAMYVRGAAEDSPMRAVSREKLGRALQGLDQQLAKHAFIAGSALTAADIMTVFSLTTMRCFSPYSLAEYPNILQYLGRIGKREAYRTAMAKSDPDMEPALGADSPKPLL